MPRKKPQNQKSYAQKAAKLRSLGYNIGYRPGRIAFRGPHYKAAVSRLYSHAQLYTEGKSKERHDFHRFRSAKSKRKWKKALSSDQVFPCGFFWQRPKGVSKKQYKLRLKKNGVVDIKVTVKGKEVVHDTAVLLDMVEVAKDSRKELEDKLSGLKRPKQLLLTVNGHDAGKQSFGDLEAFNRYLNDENEGLLVQLNNSGFDFENWGHKVFGVHMVYSVEGEEKSEGEGKVFDFESGSIFDANSKRVYGRKKYLNRKQYTKRKGKRKGK